jgi:hypothetical protein
MQASKPASKHKHTSRHAKQGKQKEEVEKTGRVGLLEAAVQRRSFLLSSLACAYSNFILTKRGVRDFLFLRDDGKYTEREKYKKKRVVDL